MSKNVKDPLRVASGKKSKRKGSRVELEVAHFLTDNGYPSRRTAQFSGKAGTSDIVSEAPFFKDMHLEVKGTLSTNICNSMYIKWLQQVEEDSQGKPWLIFHKPNNIELMVYVDSDVFKEKIIQFEGVQLHPLIKDYVSNYKAVKDKANLLLKIYKPYHESSWSVVGVFEVKEKMIVILSAELLIKIVNSIINLKTDELLGENFPEPPTL